jgi:hypothetical protein
MTLGRAGLLELLQEMKSAPEVYQPSAFWSELVDLGLKQIEGNGLENFKRTVNMTYFNWGVIGILRHHPIQKMFFEALYECGASG